MKRLNSIIIYIIFFSLVAVVTTHVYHHTRQASIRYHLGRRAFLAGDYPKAVRYYKASLALDPDREDALEGLAYSYLWSGDMERSSKLLERFLAVSDQDYAAKRTLAQNFAWQKQYAQAISLLNEILPQAPPQDQDQVLKLLAQVYLWDSQFDQARAILKDMIDTDPHDATARLLLAKTYHYEGGAEKALPIYQELMTDPQMSPEQQQELEPLIAETQMIVADYDRAIAAYKQLLEKNPDDFDARVRLADVLNWSRNYEEAVFQYQKALNVRPGAMNVMLRLAQVYSYQGQLPEAGQFLKKIIAQDPGNHEALKTLAEVLSRQKKYDEAIDYIEMLQAHQGGETETKEYGIYLLYAKRYSQAQQVFEAYLKEYQHDLEVKELLGDVLLYQGNHQQAMSVYGQILDVKKNRATMIKFADVSSWSGEYERAVDVFNQLLEEEYEIEIALKLVKVYGWMGEHGQADRIYQDILRHGDNPEISCERNAKIAYWNGRLLRRYRIMSD